MLFCGMAPQMGKGYLVAVRNMLLLLGLPDPMGSSLLHMFSCLMELITGDNIFERLEPVLRDPVCLGVE